MCVFVCYTLEEIWQTHCFFYTDCLYNFVEVSWFIMKNIDLDLDTVPISSLHELCRITDKHLVYFRFRHTLYTYTLNLVSTGFKSHNFVPIIIIVGCTRILCICQSGVCSISVRFYPILASDHQKINSFIKIFMKCWYIKVIFI